MWLSCVLALLCSASLSVEEAKTIFSKYIDAVRAGTQEEAVSYWDQEEKERYDPRYIDWQLTILTHRNDISQFAPAIISAKSTEDWVELVVEWRDEQDRVARREHRYFVEEDGRLVCANPVKVHTTGWLRKELAHIVYRVREEEEPEDAVLEEIDRFCEEVSQLLAVPLKRKIDCYKMSSSEEVGQMFDLPISMGRAYVPGYAVVCMTHFPQYEIMHIFRAELKKGRTATILYKGLGVHFGGAPFFSPNLCIHWAQQVLKVWNLPLDEINEKAYLKPGEPNNRYHCLSGAFVKYLIDQYGMRRFKEIYVAASDWPRFKELAKEICGRDITEMEQGWTDWLSSLRIETIEPGLNSHARVVFSLQDPEYDDKGDGDYVYPEGREEGIFDLAGLRVLADEERVYFELAFRKLVDVSLLEGDSTESEPLTCWDWGFRDTFAKIVISTGAESRQTRMGSNVCFDEPYNYCIDVSGSGILVCNANGIWLDLLRVKSGKPEIRDGNSLRFSVPTSIIGKPDESWKYTVLVGCHAGRETMGHGVGRYRRVGEKADEEQGGGGLDGDIDPDIYDILLPRAEDQARILGAYDEASSTLVTIPLLAKSQIQRR